MIDLEALIQMILVVQTALTDMHLRKIIKSKFKKRWQQENQKVNLFICV